QGQLPPHLRRRPHRRGLPGRRLVSLRDPGVAGAHHPGAPDRRPGSGRILLRPIGLAAIGHLRGADSQSAASRLLGRSFAARPAGVPTPRDAAGTSAGATSRSQCEVILAWVATPRPSTPAGWNPDGPFPSDSPASDPLAPGTRRRVRRRGDPHPARTRTPPDTPGTRASKKTAPADDGSAPPR